MGQEHRTYCLPWEMQAARRFLAHGLLTPAQDEARAWWSHQQGYEDLVLPIPHGVRMFVGDGVEFLRVSREGAGGRPQSPSWVRYRRWFYADGNAQPDGAVYLPPHLDGLEHAWDRLLPRWAWTTVPLA